MMLPPMLQSFTTDLTLLSGGEAFVCSRYGRANNPKFGTCWCQFDAEGHRHERDPTWRFVLGLHQEERNWVLKMHRNLGHPGSAKLIEPCKHLGCPKHIMEAIPHLQCARRLETSKPSIPRPGAIHEPELWRHSFKMQPPS